MLMRWISPFPIFIVFFLRTNQHHPQAAQDKDMPQIRGCVLVCYFVQAPNRLFFRALHGITMVSDFAMGTFQELVAMFASAITVHAVFIFP